MPQSESYGLAIMDADAAIEIDPAYVKGKRALNFSGRVDSLMFPNAAAYYRRGSAQLALGKYKIGLKDFKKVAFPV